MSVGPEEFSAALREFGSPHAMPPEVRIPRPLGVALAAVVATGVAIGVAIETTARTRILRATFLGSAFGYLAVSLLDFAEHFRLEKEETGRYGTFEVVVPGETANHVATVATLFSILAFSRTPRRRSNTRDVATLAAPALFLALGWRDELVYHRRRSLHREDVMHTVSHLAAGVMLTSFTARTLVDWKRLKT